MYLAKLNEVLSLINKMRQIYDLNIYLQQKLKKLKTSFVIL